MIDWREFIVSEPTICGGQLCAKGTRVLVTNILVDVLYATVDPRIRLGRSAS